MECISSINSVRALLIVTVDAPELCVSQIRAKEGEIIEPHKIHCIPANCLYGQLHIDPPLPETIQIDSHTNTIFGIMTLNASINYEIALHCGWVAGFEAKGLFSIVNGISFLRFDLKEDSTASSIESKLEMLIEKVDSLLLPTEDSIKSRKMVIEEKCTCPNNAPPLLLTLLAIGLLSWLFHRAMPFVIIHFAEKRD